MFCVMSLTHIICFGLQKTDCVVWDINFKLLSPFFKKIIEKFLWFLKCLSPVFKYKLCK